MSTAVAMNTFGIAGFGTVPTEAVCAHRMAAYLRSGSSTSTSARIVLALSRLT